MARNHIRRPVPGAFGKEEPKVPMLELPKVQPRKRDLIQLEKDRREASIARVYAILDELFPKKAA